MEFEWDPMKAKANLRKHNVGFEEASTIFGDPFALTFSDPAHSMGEHRFLGFGISRSGTLLVVSFTERRKKIRLISARKATHHERDLYEEG